MMAISSGHTTLVTGGAGFIGSHLCAALLKRGDRVVCVDSFDAFYDLARKERNVASLQSPNFQLHRVDLRDGEAVRALVKESGATRLAHLAARAGVRPSLQNPAEYFDVNVTATSRLLEAARENGISTCVLASSSSVYGANTRVPFRESDDVNAPISPYAASKRAMELAAGVHARLYDADVLCFRFFTVYGPRQRPDMAISLFVRAALNGEPITLFGEGQTQRDYTFIADIVDGLVSALERAPRMGFQVFNLGNENAISLRELVNAVGRATQRDLVLRYAPMQPGDVEVTLADVSRARELLGYAPKTSIDDGLRAYVQWLRDGEP